VRGSRACGEAGDRGASALLDGGDKLALPRRVQAGDGVQRRRQPDAEDGEQDGAKYRDAEGGADLPTGALGARALAAALDGNVREHHPRELGRGDPDPRTVNEQRTDRCPPGGRGADHGASACYTGDLESDADPDGRGRPKAAGKRDRQAACREAADGQRQQRDPGTERAVPDDVLQPQRQREKQPELPQADRARQDVAVTERADAEQ